MTSAGSRPIGVFDSGVGGLTVLRALHERLPHESFVYLGDTARLPYGTKSPETVARYAQQAAAVLVQRDIKLLVVACNTASAVAVEVLRTQLAPLPVIGVIEPGADAACAASASGRIVVIATEGTVRGNAYERAIASRRPDARVTARACPLFVALAEEGWVDGHVPEAVAHAYLDDLVGLGTDNDCLVLGCTHFPVLAGVLRSIVGSGVVIVDSARTTADAVDRLLAHHGLGAPAIVPAGALVGQGAGSGRARTQLLATDDRERFARVGARFLGFELASSEVALVDL
jgi:glutamate racemase